MDLETIKICSKFHTLRLNQRDIFFEKSILFLQQVIIEIS